MSNEELYKEIFKLQCEVTDLKCILFRQCATILDLIDDNRELKRLMIKNSTMEKDDNKQEHDNAYKLIGVLEKYECKHKKNIMCRETNL